MWVKIGEEFDIAFCTLKTYEQSVLEMFL